ncbi:MAG: histidinol-phosphate transaminase [Armatimonadota bacterium]
MSTTFIRPNVLELEPYSPGKPIEEVKRELGLTDVVKLASNENPLGPSPRAVEAAVRAMQSANLYPDGSCFELRQAVAKHVQVPPECLLFGNGSDELIHYIGLTFLMPGDEVITGHPSFVRYEAAAKLNNAPLHLVPLREHRFDLPAILARVNERTKLIFIANPNNPTGTIVTADEVDAFMNNLPEHVVVVWDQAYQEYVSCPDYPDTLQYVREGRNVVVLRTFSKAYALAGLRVGYAIARPDIIDAMNRVREPFNVNSVAQAAALAALHDQEHLRKAVELNRQGLEYLYRHFERLGLTYVRSEANCVMVDLGRDSQPVFQALLRKGVIVRTGHIFGLPTYLRITTGKREENERFICALEEVLQA